MTTINDSQTGKERDDMTMEEREEWLRSRGVQIETPVDRRKAPTVGASVVDQLLRMEQLSVDGEGNNDDTDNAGSVQFVCIPHDDTKPLRTLRLPAVIFQNKPGDALPEFVKHHFADRKSIDASLLKEQATKHFAGGDLAQLAETNLSSHAMNAVAAQGSVETFPLVHPADTNGYTGVYIYLDEVGLLKKLPHNHRASQMAEACGYHPAPNFYGDVFVGRVRTQPTMTNVNFVVGEDTDRGATWMQRAVAENLAWQQEMNKVTGQTGRTQPGQAGTDGKAAVEDSFEWTQDDDELEITIPNLAGDSVSLNKNSVKVVFLPRLIKIQYNGEEKIVLALYGTIDVDGCTWTIEGTKVVITCEKADSGQMWPRIRLS